MRPNIMARVICLISAAALAGCQPSLSLDAEPAQPNVDMQQAVPKTIAAKVRPKKNLRENHSCSACVERGCH